MSSDTPSRRHIVLPRFLDGWPYPRTLNPHFEPIAAASDQWFASFNALTPRHRTVFASANFGLFTALAYPEFNEEQLRIACDYMSAIFLIDDVMDGLSAREVRAIAGTVMDALRNPNKERPDGEHIIGKIWKDFWSRATRTTSPRIITRLIDHYQAYVEALCQEAEDHNLRNTRTISEYIALRHKTSGTTPSFDIFLLFLDIPEHILDHPTIMSLIDISSLVIFLINDVVSYDKEQSLGLGVHNMIVVAMKERSLDLQGAVDFIGEYCAELTQQFIATARDLPHCDDPRAAQDLATYVQGLGNWVTAFHAWSFESQRYFGTDGPKIAKHRVVELRRGVGSA